MAWNERKSFWRRGCGVWAKPDRTCSDRKLAVWKVVLAGWIKQHCGVTNRWFSETLHMGNLYGISKAVAQERKRPRQEALWRTIQTPISKA